MIKDKSMGRKLIFLDIDGTLLPPGDMLIPESTLAALDRARANGHKLFLCTGRNHRMEEGMSILPLSDYKGEPLYKIVFIADHESDLAEAKQLYADQFVFCESKLDRLTDGFVNGELINRKFDKGTGIKAICDHLGCTLADTIGFGDSDNDLQMTDVAGISVCMANGSENLKKRCDRIAPSVYEDGIAKEFKALGLI